MPRDRGQTDQSQRVHTGHLLGVWPAVPICRTIRKRGLHTRVCGMFDGLAAAALAERAIASCLPMPGCVAELAEIRAIAAAGSMCRGATMRAKIVVKRPSSLLLHALTTSEGVRDWVASGSEVSRPVSSVRSACKSCDMLIDSSCCGTVVLHSRAECPIFLHSLHSRKGRLLVLCLWPACLQGAQYFVQSVW